MKIWGGLYNYIKLSRGIPARLDHFLFLLRRFFVVIVLLNPIPNFTIMLSSLAWLCF
jgi:hypothetical protein